MTTSGERLQLCFFLLEDLFLGEVVIFNLKLKGVISNVRIWCIRVLGEDLDLGFRFWFWLWFLVLSFGFSNFYIGIVGV